VAESIRSMVIRGAPAIGVAAAMGVAIGVLHADPSRLDSEFETICDTLARTRPTAVNLFWAIDRMKKCFAASAQAGASVDEIKGKLEQEARAIHDEDVAMCRAIGRFGGELVPQTARVLTHCNAGALATAGYGTALGVVRGAIEMGKQVSVFADETRPFLQGARLTAWELHRDGIPVTLLTDGMAGWLMARGEVSCVVVGADRIAASGDVANKIGTYALAVLARHHGLPFYVAAPWSTVDLATPTGADIPIEERASDEVSLIGGVRIAPVGVKARYPAFDVTPAALVTAVVTERGVVRAPYPAALAALDRAG
jgi:methylthioribose-1-phosphate isomerase